MAAIVTRAGKGSPLTNAELDANFTNLNAELGTKGVGDVVGPAVSTHLGIPAFNGTSGKLLMGGGATLDATGQMALFGAAAALTVSARSGSGSNWVFYNQNGTDFRMFAAPGGDKFVLTTDATQTLQGVDARLVINKSGVGAPPPLDLGDTVNLVGAGPGLPNRLMMHNWAIQSVIISRRANGTPAAPAAVLNGDVLFDLQARGYGATGWTSATSGITFGATENYTDAATGGQIYFRTTPNGSNATVNRWAFTHDGHLHPLVTDAYDVGAVTNRTRAVYAGTGDFSGEITFGTGNDKVEPRGRYWLTDGSAVSLTLNINHQGALVMMNAATPLTVTIPPNSAVAFPVRARIDVVQLGAGQVSFVAGVGVTIRSAGGKLKLTGQNSAASLVQIGANDWLIIGDIAA